MVVLGGRELIDFFNCVCAHNSILSIRNLSYRSPHLNVGGISHLFVDGELQLFVDRDYLFGLPTITSLKGDYAGRSISQNEKDLLMTAINRRQRLVMWQIGNYAPEERVSLYSGRPGTDPESWSFHCALPSAR
jgi:hypothetical protein